MAKRLPPVHPGEVLREEFLVPMKLTPYALAQACGVPRTRIERLAREETPVTKRVPDAYLAVARSEAPSGPLWVKTARGFRLDAKDSAP